MTISEGNLQTIWKKVVQFVEETRKKGASDATNIATLHGELVALLEGTEAETLAQLSRGFRASYVGTMGVMRPFTEALIREYGQVLNKRGSVPEVFVDLFRDFVTNTKRVQSRGFTFASMAAGGSNVGNGAVNRLNVDAYDQVIENQTADLKTIECTADATSTATKHEEEFLITGGVAGQDLIAERGSGRSGTLTGLSARSSEQFGLRNPSFSENPEGGATTAPTAITGWTISGATVGTDFEFVTGATAGTHYYRAFNGDTTPLALRCQANTWLIYQDLQANGAQFSPNVPYYAHVAVKRRSSADGSLIFRFGASSTTQALASLSNDTYALVKIGPGDENWYKSFGEAALTLEIERTGGTTGEVDIDDVTIGAYTNFDGGWYAVVGGPTPFEYQDIFTGTDTATAAAADCIIQAWLWRALGGYLPAVPKAPTSAPTLAEGIAGNPNGAYLYKVAYVDQNGKISNLSTSATITVVSKKIELTNIPTYSGGTHIAARRIYRTVAAGSTYKLLTTLSDNSTTTFSDNVADGSLGADAPTQATMFADPS